MGDNTFGEARRRFEKRVIEALDKLDEEVGGDRGAKVNGMVGLMWSFVWMCQSTMNREGEPLPEGVLSHAYSLRGLLDTWIAREEKRREGG